VNRTLLIERIIIVVVLLASIFSPIAAVCFGAANIAVMDVLAAFQAMLGGTVELSDIKQRIILELRLPRVLLAFLCGAGLSLAGAVLQTVTRNPLADPYLFGISSGASFGAVLVIAAWGIGGSLTGQYAITMGAFAGSALSVMLVVSLAGSGVQIERMLLSGVAVSFMFSSATSLVLYSSEPQAAATLLFWTLGSFAAASWTKLFLPALVISVSIAIFLAYSRPLRAILAGDESARSLGVEVNRLRVAMLLLSSLMTATLVATCGGIGFVGLMIPHIVRRLIASHSRHVLMGSAVLGGGFMIWVDVLARELLESSELPIGVITAAIGSVFFIVVMKRKSRLT
jgi:iron complex transport system permease protein